jgi:hypothetical protein
MFTFCPARINIIDKTRKCIGFMSTTKLQTLYSNFKLRMFESQWSKLIQSTNINVINIELTPKVAKSGNTYYKSTYTISSYNKHKSLRRTNETI